MLNLKHLKDSLKRCEKAQAETGDVFIEIYTDSWCVMFSPQLHLTENLTLASGNTEAELITWLESQ